MDRREYLKKFSTTFLGLSLNTGAASLWHLVSKAETFATGSDEQKDLAAITELIIPETSTPGAISAGVPEYLSIAVTKTGDPDYAERFKSQLGSFSEHCKLQHNKAFHQLSAEQQTEHFKTLLDLNDEFVRSVREGTIVAYFTSEIGMTQALQYNPVPGKYEPCLDVTDETRGEATYY